MQFSNFHPAFPPWQEFHVTCNTRRVAGLCLISLDGCELGKVVCICSKWMGIVLWEVLETLTWLLCSESWWMLHARLQKQFFLRFVRFFFFWPFLLFVIFSFPCCRKGVTVIFFSMRLSVFSPLNIHFISPMWDIYFSFHLYINVYYRRSYSACYTSRSSKRITAPLRLLCTWFHSMHHEVMQPKVPITTPILWVGMAFNLGSLPKFKNLQSL